MEIYLEREGAVEDLKQQINRCIEEERNEEVAMHHVAFDILNAAIDLRSIDIDPEALRRKAAACALRFIEVFIRNITPLVHPDDPDADRAVMREVFRRRLEREYSIARALGVTERELRILIQRAERTLAPPRSRAA